MYDKEIAKAKADINSGRYSQEAINELNDKTNSLSRQNEKATGEILNALNKHIDGMRSSLEDEIATRGSDIVADAELLKYNLSEKELFNIINRNEHKRT